jgi:hypothetical protein
MFARPFAPLLARVGASMHVLSRLGDHERPSKTPLRSIGQGISVGGCLSVKPANCMLTTGRAWARLAGLAACAQPNTAHSASIKKSLAFIAPIFPWERRQRNKTTRQRIRRGREKA